MPHSANLNFVTPDQSGEVRFVLDNGWSGTRQAAVEVPLTDLRGGPPPKLATDGFCLTRINSGVENYDDGEQIESRWIPTVKQAVLTQTGARWVTLFAGPLRRFSNNHPLSTGSSVSAPARAVHADLHADFRFFDVACQPVAESAAADVKAEFGDSAPARWRVFNIWQMISAPPQDNSLALCRLGSVGEKDVVRGKGYFDAPDQQPQDIIDRRGDEYDFDITFFSHNPAQKWCYFSDMQPEETLIFSALDHKAGAHKARTPHAAIDLPQNGGKALPRRSIEIRALVAY